MPAQMALRTDESGRKATWLELFYDLIYVVVIARLVHSLADHAANHLTVWAVFEFIFLFIPVWWAWTGHTLFANRFDPDDTPQRLLTLAQIFFLILLAGSIEGVFSGGAFYFALYYALVRSLLVLMYWRVHSHAPHLHPVTIPFLFGFSAGVVLWLLSLAFSGALQYMLWGAALLVDFLTPPLARKILSEISVHRHHLPERLGLLTIILLGESVTGLVSGLGKGPWQWPSLMSLTGAFILMAGIWWLYFETLETLVVNAKLKAAQLAIYGHAIIYAGLAFVAAGMALCIKQETSTADTALLLSGGMIAILVPLLAVCAPLIPAPHNRSFVVTMIVLLATYLCFSWGLQFVSIEWQCLVAAVPVCVFIGWHAQRGYLLTCKID
ncbi:low temperature requirement protein A [Pelobacter seleniigenes]|uniref:low temperature requirement protein A n=1 Tax=Pelobacter seleniigenes TaxID=407188 RepID=UPI0004A71190|nr:low temperature requirement protein A [Pelobacter seleniigenes]